VVLCNKDAFQRLRKRTPQGTKFLKLLKVEPDLLKSSAIPCVVSTPGLMAFSEFGQEEVAQHHASPSPMGHALQTKIFHSHSSLAALTCLTKTRMTLLSPTKRRMTRLSVIRDRSRATCVILQDDNDVVALKCHFCLKTRRANVTSENSRQHPRPKPQIRHIPAPAHPINSVDINMLLRTKILFMPDRFIEKTTPVARHAILDVVQIDQRKQGLGSMLGPGKHKEVNPPRMPWWVQLLLATWQQHAD
jgi:hypothetical protein